MNPDEAALLQIFQESKIAQELSQGMARNDFMQDVRTQLALRHQIIVIGETVKRLSDSFRNTHPKIPWSQIAGMRDKLVHGYENVDLELVWDVVQIDIPELLQYIEPLLPKEE